MNPDTLYTISYKGAYIHAHHDRDQKREVFQVWLDGFPPRHATKCWITRNKQPLTTYSIP